MQIAGLDLGTGQCKIASLDSSGRPVVLKNSCGQFSTRSAVYFSEDGEILVGDEAIHAGLVEPSRLVTASKRKMGTGEILYRGDDGAEYDAKAIAKILIGRCLVDLERATGEIPSALAITIPANFTDQQRREVLEAAKAAGVSDVMLAQEPTAAAMAFNGRRCTDALVGVVDLGAGTLDVSIVWFDGDDRTVMTTGGERLLGGEDYTRLLEAKLLNDHTKSTGFTPDPDEHAPWYAELAQRAETAKLALSARKEVKVSLSCGGKAATITLLRSDFERAAAPLNDRLSECVQRTLAEAKVEPSDLKEILLVGGGSQPPMIKAHLESALGRPISYHPDPHHAVALGAVVMRQIELEGKGLSVTSGGERIPPTRLKVRDIMSHAVGVAILDDNDQLVNRVIMPKGTPIPHDATVAFLLAERDQDDALVQVLQGDDRVEVDQCHPLGVFELTGITPGAPRIDIRLRIDRGGVIHASASHPASGRTADLRIDAPSPSA